FWGNNTIVENFAMVDTTNVPIWLLALLSLFAIGTPFFALFVLGLKLLISNLKPMSSTLKISLIVVWALSIIGLAILGIKQATEQAYDGSTIEERALPVGTGDTLQISMRADKQFSYRVNRDNAFQIKYNADEKKFIYSNDITL